jgi:LysM repeat protein
MRTAIFITLFTLAFSAWAQKQTPQEYIEKYEELAVIEMHRSGVPASITLAQGILESNSGNSRLARLANNHFGIKCKGSWTGDVIYADDDAPDECFRAYESVLASYQDHSEFLRRNWRYHPLFELSRTDYKGWSEGLRKAGYATNPRYGDILISLIERYDLHQHDEKPLPGTGLPPLVAGPNINGVPVKTVEEGETVSSIAKDNYVKDRHIRKWNDLPKDAEVNAGEIVYLKPKRRRGSEPEHVVEAGETMRSISQKYGIKLKHLYRKNRMDKGSEPKPGEVLYMQGKRDRDDKVETAVPEPQWEEPEQKEEKFVNPHTKVDVKEVDFSKPGAIKEKEVEVPDYHVVEAGDNIYRIAERYHVFEEDILKWNKDLNPLSMKLGQKIYLSEKAAKDAGEDVSPDPEIKPEPIPSDEDMEKIKKEIVVDGPVYHIVVKGDTVYNICKRFNVTQEQLKEWNNLSDITIKIGQKLQVSE